VSCPRNTRYFVAIKMGRRQAELAVGGVGFAPLLGFRSSSSSSSFSSSVMDWGGLRGWKESSGASFAGTTEDEDEEGRLEEPEHPGCGLCSATRNPNRPYGPRSSRSPVSPASRSKLSLYFR
jgi:hypothetical protein